MSQAPSAAVHLARLSYPSRWRRLTSRAGRRYHSRSAPRHDSSICRHWFAAGRCRGDYNCAPSKNQCAIGHAAQVLSRSSTSICSRRPSKPLGASSRSPIISWHGPSADAGLGDATKCGGPQFYGNRNGRRRIEDFFVCWSAFICFLPTGLSCRAANQSTVC